MLVARDRHTFNWMSERDQDQPIAFSPLYTYELGSQNQADPPFVRSRLPSQLDLLSDNLKLDVRAHQRTYEGAYTRTALGGLSFAIMIIKLFSKEFLPVGVIYTVYGLFFYLMGMYKGGQVDFYYNPHKDKDFFRTLGTSVVIITGVSLACYIALLVLVLRM